MTATAPRTPMTGGLTRVTLVGPRRRADLVLPSDEPVGILLPEIVTLVGLGPTGSPRGYQVSRLDGQVLEPTATLRTADVCDGAVLRVDPLTEAPPAAILHDVSDEVADDLARRRGRWDGSARRWTATLTVTAAAVLTAWLASTAVPPVVLVAVGMVLLLAGSAVARAGQRPVGVAILLAGAGFAMTAVPFWNPGWATVAWAMWMALWAFVLAGAVLALGVGTGHERAGVLGASSLLVLLAGWTGPAALGLSTERVATIMAVASVAALGVLPWLALIISGLTRLDDRQAADAPVTRVAAHAAVDAAHRGLAVACVATAGSGALAGWLLARHGSGWTIALACLVAVAMLLRLRAYPLTVEVAGLIASSLTVVVGLTMRWVQADPAMWVGAAAVMLGVAAVGLTVLGYQPQPHIRARARQWGDRLEGLAVVALVPVAVGVFGVYSQLLATF
ncbi:MAG: type VII secretion integral membrane protein EccD [Pseudonocardiaceae bacterium]